LRSNKGVFVKKNRTAKFVNVAAWQRPAQEGERGEIAPFHKLLIAAGGKRAADAAAREKRKRYLDLGGKEKGCLLGWVLVGFVCAGGGFVLRRGEKKGVYSCRKSRTPRKTREPCSSWGGEKYPCEFGKRLKIQSSLCHRGRKGKKNSRRRPNPTASGEKKRHPHHAFGGNCIRPHSLAKRKSIRKSPLSQPPKKRRSLRPALGGGGGGALMTAPSGGKKGKRKHSW